MQPVQPAPPLQQPPQSKSALPMVIAVIVIVIIIVAAAVFMLMVMVPHSSATIIVNIHSTHLLDTVSYNIYFDGVLKASGSVSPGYYMAHTFTYTWQSASSTVVMISASSTGGILGTYSDYDTLTVTNGGQYTVDLYI